MGLLGFLSRKPPAPTLDDAGSLRAQPYNATVASLPPIRGTVPVAGNGPNNLETLQRTRPKAKDLPNPPSSASVASSSVLDDKLDRPRTAPSQDRQIWSSSRRTGSMKTNPVPALPPVLPPLPLSSKPPRPPYRLPDKPEPSPSASSFRSRAPWKLLDKTDKVLPELPDLDKPLPSFAARRRSSSVNSIGSGLGNGYVDLLDAQAGIAPADFRKRVQANGVRDYGEDVADRNLTESTSNLHIPGSRASFAPSIGSRPTSFIPSVHEKPEPESDRDIKLLKRHSLGSSLRTRSMASDVAVTRHSSNRRSVHADPRPRSRVRIDENGGEGLVAQIKAEWRKSLPSYMNSSGKRREDELEPFPESLRIKNDITPGSIDSRERSRSRPSLIQRPSTKDAQSKEKPASANGISSRDHASRINSEPSSSSGPVSKGSKDTERKNSIAASTAEIGQKPSKRLSLQSLQAFSKRRDEAEDEAIRIRSRSAAAEPRTHRRRASTTGSQDFPAELHFAAFAPEKPLPKHQRIGRDRLLTVKTNTHTSRSPEPFTSKTLTRVDSEDVPERSSSIRRWSMESTSATSLSSNPFRPQSRHTANTSIDLSPFAKDLNFSHDSLSIPGASDSLRPGSGRPPSPPPRSARRLQQQTKQQPTNFNIYDYVSDDDDEHAPRQPRGEGEEHLLFRDDGFAMSGFGLPGLSGAIDTDAPLYVPPSPPRSNYKPSKPKASKPKTQDYDDFLLQKYKLMVAEHKQATRPRRSRHRAAARYYEDSDSSDEVEWRAATAVPSDDSDDELSFDIPMTRRSNPSLNSSLNSSFPYRPTRYTSREQVIVEEERELPQAELPAALRSRTEDRRRKRLSGMSGMSGASGSTIRLRSDSGKGKGKEVGRLRRYDVAGFDADLD
ncbi:hypothetical protein E8E14_006439 [Neopestalotiopsis sp. 37M]|nr:hypothetical protein E8E14_006439 [Neopestalotiopsis sp. 37M]